MADHTSPWARAARAALGVTAAISLVVGGALGREGRARAELPIVDDGALRVSFGGYVRTLSGVQFLGVRGLDLPAERGLSQSLARLEWRLSLSDVATLEIHDRFALTVGSGGSGASGGAAGLGVGVTPAPARTIDTHATLADDGAGMTLDHDLDRLVLRLSLGDWDVALGRQAITWGTANLFTVADAWAAFSPFDLDTSQKRGVDAVRVGRPLGERCELDLVIADRGSVADLSGGARLTAYLDALDVYVAAAKQWSTLALLAGASLPLGQSKLRAELWAGWDSERGALLTPRATVGWDWFGADLSLTIEAHLNGAGATDSATYLSHALTAPEYARGEVFLLGRYYLGSALAYAITPRLRLTVSAMANLADPSALIMTSLRFDVAESVDLSLGAFDGVGAHGDLAAGDLASELGSYGHLIFLQLSVFL